jgi:hypothetical protein
MPHIASTVLALIAGILISLEFIISKERENEINACLRRWLTIDTKKNDYLKKTYILAAMLAIPGIAGFVGYSIWHDLQGASDASVNWRNIIWVPIFFIGFAAGWAAQWLLMKRLILSRVRRFDALFASSVVLIVLTTIILSVTVHYLNILVAMLVIGLMYGVCFVEFSIPVARFLAWFSTTDPRSPRKPRVLARIGILLFIIASVVELVSSLV